MASEVSSVPYLISRARVGCAEGTADRLLSTYSKYSKFASAELKFALSLFVAASTGFGLLLWIVAISVGPA